MTLRVDYDRGRGTMGYLVEALDRLGDDVSRVTIADEGERSKPGVRHAVFLLRTRDPRGLAELSESLSDLPEVRSVRLHTAATAELADVSPNGGRESSD
jgi:hypothetical protein